VLTVGLLGVLAIIPLGQMTVAESIRADHAGDCGRAAMRDIKVQRLLDFRSWYWEPNPSAPTAGGLWGWGWRDEYYTDGMGNPMARRDRVEINDPDSVNNAQYPDAIGSFVIDPLGISKGLPDIFYLEPGFQRGVNYTIGPMTPPLPPLSPIPVLPRRTLSPAYLNATTGRAGNFINGGRFYWPDDVSFETNENNADRPFINPNVGLDNMRSLDYSCLFTVSPSSSERTMGIQQRRMFDVTVAVFYQRNLNTTPDANHYPQGEWMANVYNLGGDNGFPGMGMGGGTVRLEPTQLSNKWMLRAYRYGGTTTNPTISDASLSRSNVPENRWVMLWDSANGRSGWYRVVGSALDIDPTVNPGSNPSNYPTISLDGPDWIPTQTTKLIVLDGVLGTYKTTVEVDYDALWGGM
jgi:hypothetical protein